MKAVKYFLYAIGAAVALALIVVIAVAVLFDPNQLKGEIERVVKQQTGRTLKLEGALHLAFWPSIGASVGRASLSERASAQPFASLESAQLAVRLLPLLRGETVVDQVRLSGLKVNLVKGRDGKFNFDDLLAAGGERPAERVPAREDGHAAPVQFDVSRVRIENASANYRDLKSGQTLEVEGVQLSTGRIASGVPGKLEFSAALKSNQPPLDAGIELSTGYRYDAARRLFALDGLTSKLTLSAPGLPQKKLEIPVSGSVQVDLGKKSAHVDLAAKLDDSNIRAKIGIEGFEPPSYNFDLEIDRLNVDRYFPPAAEGKGGSAQASTAKKGATGADSPVDLSALKGLRARGRLRIGELQVRRVKLSKVATDVRIADGRAELGPHSASLYQGGLAGTLTLDANAHRLALKEKLSDVSIGPLLADLAQRDFIAGRGEVALDLTAAGSSVNALKKSLSGSARVVLRDAAIKGLNLGESLRKAQSLGSSKSAQAQSADRAQQTDFSELSASFVIRNGVAHNDDLSAKAPLFRLTGAGDIDLASERIDYRAKAAVVGSAEGQGGRELDQLRGVSVPVRIVGPFDALKYEIDYQAVAAEMAKSRVKKKLQDKLRGLLKR
ncbi:MAG: AsmA family protein [Burkholderiales bacterium]